MKVLIGIPTIFEDVPKEVTDAIQNLRPYKYDLTCEIVNGHSRADARNAIADMALQKGYDYVLMVNPDVVIPQNTIKTFLSDPAPVIVGYNALRAPEVGRGRFPTHFDGLECAMIHTDIFANMEKPFFEPCFYAYGIFYSDAEVFCAKATSIGYTIWADTAVTYRHLFNGIYVDMAV